MAKSTPRGMIRDASKSIEELMLEYLDAIAQDLVDQVIGKAKRLTPSERQKALTGLAPSGAREYRAGLLEALSALGNDALSQARKEVPKAKKVQLDEFSKLPPELQRKIKKRVDLVVDKQLADLQSAVAFAYTANEDTTDDIDLLRGDLNDAATEWLDGTAVTAGAQISSATVVAQAREAFFFDPEVVDEIEAFEFVNGDPTSPVCQDLAGTIFSKDDPELFRYTPPLHWNCKSYIRPILNGNLGSREVTKLQPSTAALEDSIQFSDASSCSCCRIPATG